MLILLYLQRKELNVRVFFRPLGGLAVASLVALGGCSQSGGGGSVSLDTEDQRASYAIGMSMAQGLEQVAARIDLDAVVAGLRDAVEGGEPQMDDAEMEAALQAFSTSVQQEQQQEMQRAAQENLEAGRTFLEENAQREGVMTTESGLQYEFLEEGDGPTPGPEDQVRVHYRGTLLDGTEFDSSYERGEPAVFGVGGVIPGFAEGLQLTPVGSTVRLWIPGELGYGPQGAGADIGPNATLIFEVEMLEIIE